MMPILVLFTILCQGDDANKPNWDRCCQKAVKHLLLCGMKAGCSRSVRNYTSNSREKIENLR